MQTDIKSKGLRNHKEERGEPQRFLFLCEYWCHRHTGVQLSTILGRPYVSQSWETSNNTEFAKKPEYIKHHDLDGFLCFLVFWGFSVSLLPSQDSIWYCCLFSQIPISVGVCFPRFQLVMCLFPKIRCRTRGHIERVRFDQACGKFHIAPWLDAPC